MKPVLKKQNSHPRDDLIKFYARGHRYEILSDPGTKYTSVTTWNHQQFPKFDADAVIAKIFKSKTWGPDHKYWGQSAEQIKASWKSNGEAVSNSGTNLHERIEHFMNNSDLKSAYTHSKLYDYYKSNSDEPDEPKEWLYFLQFICEHPDFQPFRTEWMIFDEDLKLAGSIDMVYQNPDGSLMIYDWKRSKEITKVNSWNQFASNPLISHLHDTNFWHYALQLNTYKSILERKYGKTVNKLCLVRLHPDIEEETYELLEVPILNKEIIDLFEERKKQLSA
jgi:ATP-dependent exoDNAse (exonuclease V) beta subunit